MLTPETPETEILINQPYCHDNERLKLKFNFNDRLILIRHREYCTSQEDRPQSTAPHRKIDHSLGEGALSSEPPTYYLHFAASFDMK